MPDKSGKFGDRGLGFKTVDIANLSDDTSRVNFANTGNGGQGIRDDFKLVFNGLVQHLDLLFQSPHGGNRDCHRLIYRIVHSNRQAVRVSGGSSNNLGFGSRVSEVSALLIQEGS